MASELSSQKAFWSIKLNKNFSYTCSTYFQWPFEHLNFNPFKQIYVQYVTLT